MERTLLSLGQGKRSGRIVYYWRQFFTRLPSAHTEMARLHRHTRGRSETRALGTRPDRISFHRRDEVSRGGHCDRLELFSAPGPGQKLCRSSGLSALFRPVDPFPDISASRLLQLRGGSSSIEPLPSRERNRTAGLGGRFITSRSFIR